MKAVRTIFTSNGAPYLQMRPLGSHSTLGKEKERKKETAVYNYFILIYNGCRRKKVYMLILIENYILVKTSIIPFHFLLKCYQNLSLLFYTFNVDFSPE
jgi:hypothetical protein